MAKKTKAFGSCCGLNEQGIDAMLFDAEQLDVGTARFPWPKGLKDTIKAEVDGMVFMPAVKEKINALVVAKAGPGLFNRGPYNLPVV